MRSIRLSLIVYFLVLLALALGTASMFVYETTRQTLLGRKEALHTLLKEKHDHRVQEVREKFDHDLLAQAWTLGSLAQFQHDWQAQNGQRHITRLMLDPKKRNRCLQ